VGYLNVILRKIVLDAPKTMKVGDIRAVHANVGINVPIEVLLRYSGRAETQSVKYYT